MKVLVATDGSDYSQRALGRMGEFLPAKTSEVLLLMVIPNPATGGLGLIGPPYIDYAALADQLRSEAQAVLDKGAATLQDQGFKVRLVYREGDPATEILELAQSEDVGMIVVGSHGRTGVRRFLLGSVSSRIVSHAPCSVLVIKHPPTA
jgi:nucleotide-binding universal stress UspA family protein